MKFDNETIESGTRLVSQDSVIQIKSTWLILTTESSSSTLLINERTLVIKKVGNENSLARAIRRVHLKLH